MGDEQKSFWKDLDKEILGRAPSQVWKFLEIWEGLVLLQDIKGWLVVYDRKTQELRKFQNMGAILRIPSLLVTQTLVFINEWVVIK